MEFWLMSILHYRKGGYLQVLLMLYRLYSTILQFHFLQMWVLVVVVVGSSSRGLATVPIMVVHNVLQHRDHIIHLLLVEWSWFECCQQLNCLFRIINTHSGSPLKMCNLRPLQVQDKDVPEDNLPIFLLKIKLERTWSWKKDGWVAHCLGHRVGPWIPDLAFAGAGTSMRPQCFMGYKNESYK